MEPKIVEAPKDVEVEMGEEVIFTVVAEGVPTPDVIWFEDDVSLRSISTISGNKITR